MAILLVTSKGAAAVTGGDSLLASTLMNVIPLEGLALLLGGIVSCQKHVLSLI